MHFQVEYVFAPHCTVCVRCRTRLLPALALVGGGPALVGGALTLVRRSTVLGLVRRLRLRSCLIGTLVGTLVSTLISALVGGLLHGALLAAAAAGSGGVGTSALESTLLRLLGNGLQVLLALLRELLAAISTARGSLLLLLRGLLGGTALL